MERYVRDIPHMYSEMMVLMKMQGKEENSRNGTVLTLQEPLTVTVHQPSRRVLYDPIRNANPFFHVMEFVWMMSGSKSSKWISQFNSRFTQYADTDGTIHGAYGHRWLHHLSINQITIAVQMLKDNPESRRVVLQMWDSTVDLGTEHNDLPCNTQIYLRICKDKLEMTVCNRSNDVIWGMTGANAVHMTFLQELMALEIGVSVGEYRVFTNNAHVYTDLPQVEDMLNTRYPHWSILDAVDGVSLLSEGESITEFLEDCIDVTLGSNIIGNNWLNTVALPIRNIYLDRKDNMNNSYIDACETIADYNWRVACIEWLQRKAG